ncbi:uncharacterized protein LOC112458622 [Temnothorax curvispinosus]|uniref:Uncharacterized protein LOC112458622 n=1 Tax=Temnothorax curvispinosus TaxID=300111 RepID=A0A6J1Q9V1_9HYME|nr:uncharacterized protein LOC112458622 [Temnothorax curvispinosus]
MLFQFYFFTLYPGYFYYDISFSVLFGRELNQISFNSIVFYEMTEFHKRFIGERRLRRYAKAEAEKDNVKFHLFHEKGTSTKRRKSNKPGQIVENKRRKKNIALNDQHDQSDKSFEEMSMTEFVSRINSTK